MLCCNTVGSLLVALMSCSSSSQTHTFSAKALQRALAYISAQGGSAKTREMAEYAIKQVLQTQKPRCGEIKLLTSRPSVVMGLAHMQHYKFLLQWVLSEMGRMGTEKAKLQTKQAECAQGFQALSSEFARYCTAMTKLKILECQLNAAEQQESMDDLKLELAETRPRYHEAEAHRCAFKTCLSQIEQIEMRIKHFQILRACICYLATARAPKRDMEPMCDTEPDCKRLPLNY